MERSRGTLEVACTSGCFDILHAGHVSFLRRARAMAGMLVVCINDDDSVRRLKGEKRPVCPLWERMLVLRELRCVDLVLPFAEDTPVEVLRSLQPEWFVKGAEYANEEIVEQLVMKEWGGHVVFLPREIERSTSGILETCGNNLQRSDRSCHYGL